MKGFAAIGMIVAVGAGGVCGPVRAQGVASTVTQQGVSAPAGPTVQQAFDAADTLDKTGTPAARLEAWEALERRVSGNKRTQAIVRIRKAEALMRLDRLDEAVASIRAGLANLPAGDTTLAEDRAIGWLTLGQAAIQSLDYAGAVDAFRQGEATATTPALKLTAWIGLFRTEPYVDPDSAARTVARVEPQIAAMNIDKTSLARLRRYDAERLMNRGGFAAALARAKEAVKLLGGLTEKTDIEDAAARSDVAIAALRLGETTTAREYIAMTGAGRSTKGALVRAAHMEPPPCGGDAGLRPQDVAVIEFSIGADGGVVSSVPVYAEGGGKVALEFARAAYGWSWAPEQLKDLPTFFRVRTRIEMRCSTALPRPGITAFLDSELSQWLDSKGVSSPAPDDDLPDVTTLPMHEAALAKAETAGAQSLEILPPLVGIARNSISTQERTNAVARRAVALLSAKGAPPLVRLGMAQLEWRTRSADGRRGDPYRKAIQGALGDPIYAGDSQARAALLIMQSDAESPGSKGALAALRAIRDDARLAKDSPLRVAALARLASSEQTAGNSAAALQAFENSGLTANQCAIVDSAPKLLRATGTYPNEAVQWGFDGWAVVQSDVTAAGTTTNIRTVLAYPPFIFSKASEQGVAGAKYAKSFRPDGGLGCGGVSTPYRFISGL